MNKLVLLAPLAALLLAGCDYGAITSAGSAAVGIGSILLHKNGPAAQAVDPQLLKSDIKRAHEAIDSFTAAANDGHIARSSDPDTARPNFCKLVMDDLAILDMSNAGSKGSALTCQIEYYAEHPEAGGLAKLETYTDQLVALVKAANEGVKS